MLSGQRQLDQGQQKNFAEKDPGQSLSKAA